MTIRGRFIGPLLALVGIVVFVSAAAGGADTATADSLVAEDRPTSGPATSAKAFREKPFVVCEQLIAEPKLRTAGDMLFYCMDAPSPNAVAELRQQQAALGRVPTVTLIVCAVTDQIQTIESYAPVCDGFWVVPFYLPSKRAPQKGDLIWTGYDHPLINRLRHIHSLTRKQRVVAILTRRPFGNTVWGASGKRSWTTEELEWQVLAVIGAEFKGIHWRNRSNKRGIQTTSRRLERGLKRHAMELGKAHLVGWVNAPDAQPVSALASEKSLFIVLLNPDVMKLDRRCKAIGSRVERSVRSGRLSICPPPGLTVRNGRELSGQPARVIQEGAKVLVEYSFMGGGKMFVFDLTGNAAQTKPAETPAPADN